jgi:chromate transporter
MGMTDTYLSVFLTFLRFGLNAWGGPVAQIAMIRAELVDKHRWVTPERFRRTLALYQALPGPEAHELCVYLGMVRAGRIGGFLAGLGFMLPGLLLIVLLAWAYGFYGASRLLPLFAGVAPAVAALIVRATHRLGADLLTETSHRVIALATMMLSLLGVHFLPMLIAAAIGQALWSTNYRKTAGVAAAVVIAIATVSNGVVPTPSIAADAGGLLLEGFKAGMLSFGGAYTAIPFLHDNMVGHYPNVTQQVFLDGIAIASAIPAPLIIFGSFLGYVAGGPWGAVLMTFGIFLPAFCFTLLGHAILERIIENRALHGLLDGISAAVVGLLAVSAIGILQSVVTGWLQLAFFSAALAVFYLLRGRWVVPSVIAGCGLAGTVLHGW